VIVSKANVTCIAPTLPGARAFCKKILSWVPTTNYHTL